MSSRRIVWSSIIALFASLVTAGCEPRAPSVGTHVHGAARLSIAIVEPMIASVDFAAPSESVYGFEYEATTAEEIAARDGAISALENRFGEMFQLPDAFGCRVVEAYVEIKIGTEFDVGDRADPDDGAGDPTGSDNGVRDDERVGERVGAQAGHVPPGEHVEVHANYRLECASDLAGASARVTIGDFFPGIRTLNVIMLSEAGQQGATLEGGSGSIDL